MYFIKKKYKQIQLLFQNKRSTENPVYLPKGLACFNKGYLCISNNQNTFIYYHFSEKKNWGQSSSC